jgi:hypothetical protein
VAERLQGRGVDAMAAEWDAWRHEDGRWAVQATYHSGERERSARFLFDAVGRYSLADDDEAKWLTGERQSTSRGPQPREGGHSGEGRVSAVADEDDDLLALSDDAEPTDDLTAVVRAVRERRPSDAGPPEQPDVAENDAAEDDVAEDDMAEDDAAEDLAEEGDAPPPASAPLADQPDETADPTGGQAAAVEPTPERRRRSKRASVPSWDEIMFGKDDD